MIVHLLKDAFAEREQLLARFGDQRLGQKLFSGDGFECGLRTVQAIQGAFQGGDGEGSVGRALVAGIGIQGTGQLCATALEFE